MIAYCELMWIIYYSCCEWYRIYMHIYVYIHIYIYEITMHQIYDTRLPFLHVFFWGFPILIETWGMRQLESGVKHSQGQLAESMSHWTPKAFWASSLPFHLASAMVMGSNIQQWSCFVGNSDVVVLISINFHLIPSPEKGPATPASQVTLKLALAEAHSFRTLIAGALQGPGSFTDVLLGKCVWEGKAQWWQRLISQIGLWTSFNGWSWNTTVNERFAYACMWRYSPLSSYCRTRCREREGEASETSTNVIDHLTCQRLEPLYKTLINQFWRLTTCDRWFYQPFTACLLVTINYTPSLHQ